MTEFVTPHLRTVLKTYQNSATKSLQGPGQSLPSVSAQHHLSPHHISTHSAAAAAAAASASTTVLQIPSQANHLTNSNNNILNNNNCNLLINNGSNTNSNLINNHHHGSNTKLQSSATSASSGASSQSGAGSAGALSLQTAAAITIKKEILSSPEPVDCNDTTDMMQNVIVVQPPPPPELPQPILTAPDSGCGELLHTELEGKPIGCFLLGGEMRLCLPQFLNNVLTDFTLDQINRIFDDLRIFCSQCSPDQLMKFKAAKILPDDVKAAGLITRTDAERLCAALLHRSDNGRGNIDIPKGAISFRVYHRCFGKCEGICIPDLYSFQKPSCIRCCECKGLFSPQKFVGHVHRLHENRTCHWGFDSRNWRDYLHVALDEDNREKYTKLLDDLKDLEQQENLNAELQMAALKRKVEEEEFMSPMGCGKRNANRDIEALLADVPSSKKQKILEESAFLAEVQQRYHQHAIMYAHYQREQQMSAFRPWAQSKPPPPPPPSILPMPYNVAVAAATLPYLSQEPPVLQNPERVVRNTESERFERTYQPNVALAPRKSILSKERERERERERNERRNLNDRERSSSSSSSNNNNVNNLNNNNNNNNSNSNSSMNNSKINNLNTNSKINNAAITTNLSDIVDIRIKQERPNSPPLIDAQQQQQQQQSPDDIHSNMVVSPPILNSNSSCNINSSSNNINANKLSNNSLQPHQIRHLHQQHIQQQQAHSNTNHLQQFSISGHQQSHNQFGNLPLGKLQSNNKNCITPGSVKIQPCSPEEFSGSNEITSSTSPMPQQSQQHPNQSTINQSILPSVAVSPHSITPPTPTNPNDESNNYLHLSAAHRQHLHLHHHHHALNVVENMIKSPTPMSNQTIITPKHEKPNLSSIIDAVAADTNATATTTTPSAPASANNQGHRIHISKNLLDNPNVVRSPTPPSLREQYNLKARTIHHHHQMQQLQLQQQQQQQHIQQHQSPSQSSSSSNLAYITNVPSTTSGPNIAETGGGGGAGVVVKNFANINGVSIVNKLHNSQHNLIRLNYNHSSQANSYQHQNTNQQQQQHHQQRVRHTDFDPLSPDTDDESLNGEPDSSISAAAAAAANLVPWDLAAEALKDASPVDREKILQIIKMLVHENAQLRQNSMDKFQLLQELGQRNEQINDMQQEMQHLQRQVSILTAAHNKLQSTIAAGSSNNSGVIAKTEKTCIKDLEDQPPPHSNNSIAITQPISAQRQQNASESNSTAQHSNSNSIDKSNVPTASTLSSYQKSECEKIKVPLKKSLRRSPEDSVVVLNHHRNSIDDASAICGNSSKNNMSSQVTNATNPNLGGGGSNATNSNNSINKMNENNSDSNNDTKTIDSAANCKRNTLLNAATSNSNNNNSKNNINTNPNNSNNNNSTAITTITSSLATSSTNPLLSSSSSSSSSSSLSSPSSLSTSSILSSTSSTASPLACTASASLTTAASLSIISLKSNNNSNNSSNNNNNNSSTNNNNNNGNKNNNNSSNKNNNIDTSNSKNLANSSDSKDEFDAKTKLNTSSSSNSNSNSNSSSSSSSSNSSD